MVTGSFQTQFVPGDRKFWCPGCGFNTLVSNVVKDGYTKNYVCRDCYDPPVPPRRQPFERKHVFPVSVEPEDVFVVPSVDTSLTGVAAWQWQDGTNIQWQDGSPILLA